MVKEILIGASLGAALGFWWQTYHWNEAKKVGAAVAPARPALVAKGLFVVCSAGSL